MAKTKNSVSTELMKVSGVKVKEGQSRQSFLKKLAAAVNALDEDDWNSLSEEAQEWNNSAVKSIAGKKDIEDFPDAAQEEKPKKKKAKPAEAETDDEAAGDDDEDEKPKKVKASKKDDDQVEAEDEDEDEQRQKSKKTKTATKSKKKAADDEDEDEDEKPAKKKKDTSAGSSKPTRALGGQAFIKKLVIKNPSMPTEKLMEKAEAKGYKLSKTAVSTFRSGTRNTIKLLQECGFCEEITL